MKQKGEKSSLPTFLMRAQQPHPIEMLQPQVAAQGNNTQAYAPHFSESWSLFNCCLPPSPNNSISTIGRPMGTPVGFLYSLKSFDHLWNRLQIEKLPPGSCIRLWKHARLKTFFRWLGGGTVPPAMAALLKQFSSVPQQQQINGLAHMNESTDLSEEAQSAVPLTTLTTICDNNIPPMTRLQTWTDIALAILGAAEFGPHADGIDGVALTVLSPAVQESEPEVGHTRFQVEVICRGTPTCATAVGLQWGLKEFLAEDKACVFSDLTVAELELEQYEPPAEANALSAQPAKKRLNKNDRNKKRAAKLLACELNDPQSESSPPQQHSSMPSATSNTSSLGAEVQKEQQQQQRSAGPKTTPERDVVPPQQPSKKEEGKSPRLPQPPTVANKEEPAAAVLSNHTNIGTSDGMTTSAAAPKKTPRLSAVARFPADFDGREFDQIPKGEPASVASCNEAKRQCVLLDEACFEALDVEKRFCAAMEAAAGEGENPHRVMMRLAGLPVYTAHKASVMAQLDMNAALHTAAKSINSVSPTGSGKWAAHGRSVAERDSLRAKVAAAGQAGSGVPSFEAPEGGWWRALFPEVCPILSKEEKQSWAYQNDAIAMGNSQHVRQRTVMQLAHFAHNRLLEMEAVFDITYAMIAIIHSSSPSATLPGELDAEAAWNPNSKKGGPSTPLRSKVPGRKSSAENVRSSQGTGSLELQEDINRKLLATAEKTCRTIVGGIGTKVDGKKKENNAHLNEAADADDVIVQDFDDEEPVKPPPSAPIENIEGIEEKEEEAQAKNEQQAAVVTAIGEKGGKDNSNTSTSSKTDPAALTGPKAKATNKEEKKSSTSSSKHSKELLLPQPDRSDSKWVVGAVIVLAVAIAAACILTLLQEPSGDAF